MNDNILPVTVMGHVKIADDLGTVLLDKKNAVHPQNMARVIARALAHESNFFIHRIAFGNGGTVVQGAGAITYNTPNDGITDNAGHASRLYNETYYEIIDENGPSIGYGPGANPAGDSLTPTTPNVQDGPGVFSQEIGIISQVVISAVLNPGEPSGQFNTDNQSPTENTESDFTFDEIGLFTFGAPDSPTAGYQEVDVGNKVATNTCGISPGVYHFDISVDGGAPQTISLTVPSGPFTFGDLVSLLNFNLSGSGATASITNPPTVQTYGFLKFTSNTTGPSSSVAIVDETAGSPGVPTGDWLFSNISSWVGINAGIPGLAAGVINDPVNPSTELERMLTHIIFSPVLKSANRTLTITYTLTVQVAQSV